jgi:hypothetical protein
MLFNMNFKLDNENWFWCDVCQKVSYDFKCQCQGTSCNAISCKKCYKLHDLVKKYKEQNLAPTKEEAIEINIKKFGTKETPETIMINKIFGKKIE